MILRIRCSYGQIRLEDVNPEATVTDLYSKIDDIIKSKGLKVNKVFKDVSMLNPLFKSTEKLKSLNIHNGDMLFVDSKPLDKQEEADIIDLTQTKKRLKVVNEIKILTYNIWFEDVAVDIRMKAISDIVQSNAVHICCFQECTEFNIALLKQHLSNYTFIRLTPKDWPFDYFVTIAYRRNCSKFNISVDKFKFHAFSNSKMGRGLLYGIVNCRGNSQEISFIIGTAHLESPLPKDKMIPQRTSQLNESYRLLERLKDQQAIKNIFLLGDLNWISHKLNTMEVKSGWIDVWSKLKSTKGYTYDQKINDMLMGKRYRSRLDRVLTTIQPEQLRIEIVGNSQVEDSTYKAFCRYKQVQKTLPVFPSDHFGLIVSYAP